MNKKFCSNLTTFLNSLKNKNITTIKPGGNNGDQLIYKGLNKKLEMLNINYNEICYRKHIIPFGIMLFNKIFNTNINDIFLNKNTDLILVHGGGNMNDIYSHGTTLLKNLIIFYPTIDIVVAPQTYYYTTTDFRKIFEKSNQNITLFCREKVSYNYLEGLNLPNNVKPILSDDTAFYLEPSDFDKGKQKNILIVFREDIEIHNKISKLKLDILNEVKNRNMIYNDFQDPKKYSFERYISEILSANIVIADRLHVSIISSILGKKTFILPNSYFKNKAVYDYSLKYFKNTDFIDENNTERLFQELNKYE